METSTSSEIAPEFVKTPAETTDSGKKEIEISVENIQNKSDRVQNLRSFFHHLSLRPKPVTSHSSPAPELYGGKYAGIAESRYGKGPLARHGEAAIAGADLKPGQVILEVGCNTGMLLDQLREGHKFTATGLDINLNALETAHGKKHEVIGGNAQSLPIKDASVDRIISLHTYEHVENLNEALQELYRVLKHGGRAVIIEPPNLGGLETIRVAMEDLPPEKKSSPGLIESFSALVEGMRYARRLHCSTLGGPFGGAGKEAEKILKENGINLKVTGGMHRDLAFANLLIFEKP